MCVSKTSRSAQGQTFRWFRFSLASLLVVLTCACVALGWLWIASSSVQHVNLPDGIYRVPLPELNEGGVEAARSDADGTVVLRQRLADNFGTASMQSVANDNTRFRIDLKAAGPVSEGHGTGYYALVIDGICVMVWSRTDPDNTGRVKLSARVVGKKPSARIAKRLGIKPRLRQHPGHRVDVRFVPSKAKFQLGEPVVLQMEIKNVGDVPFSFYDGGKQRGARNNQFAFTAFRNAGNGPEVPDTGDSTHFGGPAGLKTLKPGANFQKKVEINRWFDISKSDTYRIRGHFQLELHDPNEEGYWTQWEEVARGECLVVVGGAEVAAANDWGDPIAGVQSRIETINAVGQQGGPPVLHSYIRRQGDGDLILALVAWPDNWLDVDGKKYRHHGQSVVEKVYRSARDFIEWGNDSRPRLVTLDDKWRSVEDNKSLKLLPGRHTVRYGYDGFYPRAAQPNEPDRRRPVVLWSNPVDIAMLEHVEVAITGTSNLASERVNDFETTTCRI